MIEAAKKAVIKVYDTELEKWLLKFLELPFEFKILEFLSLSSSRYVDRFKFYHNGMVELDVVSISIRINKICSVDESIIESFKKLINELRKQLSKRFEEDYFREFIEELIE